MAEDALVHWKDFQPLHQTLAENIAVNSKRLDIMEANFKAANEVINDTNKQVRDHIAKEDLTWERYTGRLDKIDEKLDALKSQIAGPPPPKSIKYSTIRKWAWRIGSIVSGSILLLYYLTKILHY